MKDRFWAVRHGMVDAQIRRRGVVDPRVLEALSEVPRHLFVPPQIRDGAYDDIPLAIGQGQTISQPYIVALMTSALELTGAEKVLEVGTGSGYQAAILSRLAAEVHTVELLPALAARAARILARLRCDNVTVHVGDGSLGWPESAPYGAIIVTAAAPSLPRPLTEQLVDGGRLVIPLASPREYQVLTLFRSEGGRISEHPLASVAFVPLRGRFGVKS